MLTDKLQTGKLLNLDVIRAVAVFLVIGRHFALLPTTMPDNSLIRLWERGGWVGVDIFFVLSGFLVSGLLFREFVRYQRVSIPRFLIRRGLKIYPAFYVFIIVSVLVRLLTQNNPKWNAVICECLFIQNYGNHLWEHTWSLAVEEHFYLLLCIGISLALWYRRPAANPFTGIPAFTLTVAGMVLVLRILTGWFQPFSLQTNVFPTHLRVDSLLFGVFLSYLYHFRHSVWEGVLYPRRYYIGVLGICLLLPAFLFQLNTPFIYIFGPTLFYLGGGAFVIFAVSSKQLHNRIGRGLAFLGANSYSIYLWHLFVCQWVMLVIIQKVTANSWNWWVYALIYVVGSCAFGILMNRLVETPVLLLRDKIFPSRSGPIPVSAAAPSSSAEILDLKATVGTGTPHS